MKEVGHVDSSRLRGSRRFYINPFHTFAFFRWNSLIKESRCVELPVIKNNK